MKVQPGDGIEVKPRIHNVQPERVTSRPNKTPNGSLARVVHSMFWDRELHGCLEKLNTLKHNEHLKPDPALNALANVLDCMPATLPTPLLSVWADIDQPDTKTHRSVAKTEQSGLDVYYRMTRPQMATLKVDEKPEIKTAKAKNEDNTLLADSEEEHVYSYEPLTKVGQGRTPELNPRSGVYSSPPSSARGSDSDSSDRGHPADCGSGSEPAEVETETTIASSYSEAETTILFPTSHSSRYCPSLTTQNTSRVTRRMPLRKAAVRTHTVLSTV